MTTSNDPDQIRREIEATRAELSNDVNALSDKVSPAQIAERQKAKISGAARSVKESIMGSADSATSSAQGALSTVQDKVGQVGDAVSDAPDTVKTKTRGNPLAAGIIAFGAGLLVVVAVPGDAEGKPGRRCHQGEGTAARRGGHRRWPRRPPATCRSRPRTRSNR